MTLQSNYPMFIPSGNRAAVSFQTLPPNDRHETIRKDISSRLRNICSNLSEDEFAELVEQMLQAQLVGERRYS